MIRREKYTMETMVNNETSVTKEKSGGLSLDKTGIIILAVSAVIALALVIVGVVLLVGGSGDGYGPKALSLGYSVHESASRGEAFNYTYKCDESGYYYIYVDGASLASVYYDGSRISYSTISNRFYDNAYELHMIKDHTYEITIRATESDVLLKLDQSN